MPITPKDAAAKNDRDASAALKAAEKKVDTILSRGYRSGYTLRIAHKTIADMLPDYSDRERLMDTYRRAGWDVEHFTSQKDGDNEFIFSSENSRADPPGNPRDGGYGAYSQAALDDHGR